MRQLRALEQQGGKENGVSRHLGIIYLSWSVPLESHKRQEASLQKQWRVFVDHEVTTMFHSSILFEDLRWMNDDLFILMKLPSGTQELLEGWLLELVYKHAETWGQRFIDNLNRDDRSRWKGMLHSGVSVVAEDTSLTNEDFWYEAMKRAILHGQSAGAMKHSMKRRAIDKLLENRMIKPVYQPIIALQHSGEVFGYEALSRTEDQTWFSGPMELFLFAEKEGLAYALDRLAREKAIAGCKTLGKEQKLFINVMAQIMEDPSFSPGQTLGLLEQHHLSPHNIVFEITERSEIADFASVKKALEHYRSQGYQIAIDDVGAGYSSLQSIVELRPDYLKVDRSIIQNIHMDEMKEHILHTLIQLASKMGISVIAEGIEQEEELALVRKMGVQYAQGYLLGKPAAF